MNVRDLEYFLCLAETRNFTAAARRAHIVQSAMSAAVARLERDLRVVLVDRTSTPVTLTGHGEALRDGARQVLDSVRQVHDRLDAVGGTVGGTVTLGATLATGPLDLAAALARMRAEHPAVRVRVRQSSAGSVGNVAGVLDGSLDIALTAADDPAPRDGVTLHPLVEEPLVFVCRPDHPLAARARVTVARIADERILRFPPGWGVRSTVDRVLGAGDGEGIEAADYGLMGDLVDAGFGTTLMPASAAASLRRRLATIEVAAPCPTWRLAAATSSVRRLSAATRALLAVLIAESSPPPAPG